jgi:hypothetical protein
MLETFFCVSKYSPSKSKTTTFQNISYFSKLPLNKFLCYKIYMYVTSRTTLDKEARHWWKVILYYLSTYSLCQSKVSTSILFTLYTCKTGAVLPSLSSTVYMFPVMTYILFALLLRPCILCTLSSVLIRGPCHQAEAEQSTPCGRSPLPPPLTL